MGECWVDWGGIYFGSCNEGISFRLCLHNKWDVQTTQLPLVRGHFGYRVTSSPHFELPPTLLVKVWGGSGEVLLLLARF